jgi:hypothetical protein
MTEKKKVFPEVVCTCGKKMKLTSQSHYDMCGVEEIQLSFKCTKCTNVAGMTFTSVDCEAELIIADQTNGALSSKFVKVNQWQ